MKERTDELTKDLFSRRGSTLRRPADGKEPAAPLSRESKVTLALDVALLAKIDQAAARVNMSRERMLANLVKEGLAQLQPPEQARLWEETAGK